MDQNGWEWIGISQQSSPPSYISDFFGQSDREFNSLQIYAFAKERRINPAEGIPDAKPCTSKP